MKIFLSQQNYHIGNFEENTRKIIGSIGKAKEAGADLGFDIGRGPGGEFEDFGNIEGGVDGLDVLGGVGRKL
jgi:hypothetical protein